KVLIQLVKGLLRVGVQCKRLVFLRRPPPSFVVLERPRTMVLCKHSPPISFPSTHSHDTHPSHVWSTSAHCKSATCPMSGPSCKFHTWKERKLCHNYATCNSARGQNISSC